MWPHSLHIFVVNVEGGARGSDRVRGVVGVAPLTAWCQPSSSEHGSGRCSLELAAEILTGQVLFGVLGVAG